MLSGVDDISTVVSVGSVEFIKWEVVFGSIVVSVASVSSVSSIVISVLDVEGSVGTYVLYEVDDVSV